jgi:hypothetical protein
MPGLVEQWEEETAAAVPLADVQAAYCNLLADQRRAGVDLTTAAIEAAFKTAYAIALAIKQGAGGWKTSERSTLPMAIIRSVTVSFKGTIPTQSFGGIAIQTTWEADLEPGESPEAVTQQLFQRIRGEVTQAVAPIAQAKLRAADAVLRSLSPKEREDFMAQWGVIQWLQTVMPETHFAQPETEQHTNGQPPADGKSPVAETHPADEAHPADETPTGEETHADQRTDGRQQPTNQPDGSAALVGDAAQGRSQADSPAP